MTLKILLTVLLLCPTVSVAAQSIRPRTVRDYFMLLPQSLFAIESCNTEKVKDCRPYKIDYLKKYLEIEDVKNGFMSGTGDGAQESFEMALFIRSNESHIIGLHVLGEWGDTYRFLSYDGRRWKDMSKTVVPNYSRSNVYRLPRTGSTVAVFERRNFDPKNNQGEQGGKLYDLVWKSGKFVKREK